MKAAVLHAPNKILIEEVEKPKIGANDILVKVKGTAICGTDIDTFRGKYNVKYPAILGHEASGEIAEVGRNVTAFQPSDRVLIDPIFSCGKCYLCLMGKKNLCINGGLLGRDIGNGSYAEYVSIPDHLAFKFSETLSYEEATLIELLATVYHGQKRIRMFPGNSVAILGQGAAGLLHTKLAKLSGAIPVITTDILDNRLDMSKKFGADITINSRNKDLVKEIPGLTSSRGLDVVIDAAGVPYTLKQALEIVRPGGTILQFGVHTRPVDNINLISLYFKEIEIVGTRACVSDDFDTSIKLVTRGIVDVKPLISHVFPLQKLEESFQLAEKSPDEVIKMVVKA